MRECLLVARNEGGTQTSFSTVLLLSALLGNVESELKRGKGLCGRAGQILELRLHPVVETERLSHANDQQQVARDRSASTNAMSRNMKRTSRKCHS